ncbi:DUF3263 domain-containing protein, partial [Streptomyces sp. NPDC127044]
AGSPPTGRGGGGGPPPARRVTGGARAPSHGATRPRLGLAPVRYYQLLNALLDDPRALAHDPITVNRLRRIRDTRRAER